MKACLLSVVAVVVCCSSRASGFVVPTLAPGSSGIAFSSTASTAHRSPLTSPAGRAKRALCAENPANKAEGEEEQAPMDLDLEQMFEVFEAADKEVSDESVGKKGGKKPAGKDAGEAMGDMLSSFFGGGKK